MWILNKHESHKTYLLIIDKGSYFDKKKKHFVKKNIGLIDLMIAYTEILIGLRLDIFGILKSQKDLKNLLKLM